jgi:xylulose-5-phosphate/fructose-6-phosphate phosphoketolase
MSTTEWIGVAGAAELLQAAYRRILGAAARAIEQRGRFLIVLAGGDTPRDLYRMMRTADTDWSRWHVYFGDERCLAPEDYHRNSRMAEDAWLDHVAIPRDQMHAIPVDLGASAAALAYAETLCGIGEFDLVVLGLGEDGHTASLFPGREWGAAADAPDALAVFDAPKPPLQRVSLSAARLSRARAVLFLVEGEAKRAAVMQWRAGGDIPARAVRPQAGVVVLAESTLLKAGTLTPELLHQIDAYWRAANYLSVGQIYLYDNPLLERPLELADVKHMLLGHWGTTPGQNFIYAHLNRVIRKYDLDMIYVSGPGHGGPAVVANTYLEGTYSEIYPDIGQDTAGLRKLFLQFSFPGGIPSHASPECPGSIHEGGELGYSLSHSFGAAFDNPDLVVACVVGDGEAETGPLATAWHSNKFLDPVTDGAVLPILHLNGYKISNPTVLARITREELQQLLRGYGWTPHFVEGHEPALMHEAMAATLDTVVEEIRRIQQDARVHGNRVRARWPMIVLDSPKGWTGPKRVDGLQIEGTFRSHQVPLAVDAAHAQHLRQLEAWMKSYRPEELFDAQGRLRAEWAALAPTGERRMGANPHANGGILLRDLRMPDYRGYAVDVPSPGVRGIGDTHVLGPFLRDVAKLNGEERNFRVFGPDETLSNGLEALFEVTPRQWDAATVPNDEFLAPTGRVMEMLSEHQCEGWLEGYLLTGRHGLFNCYEAFIHIVDSMFNQHAKWLKVSSQLPWRRKIASLNYLLASHVWRQDHNGFTHQDPGFIDHVVNKKAEIVRVYLPPDANCLLSVMDHCLRSRHYVNVVVAGKHPAPQWLAMDAAVKHCAEGIGIWQWASNDQGVTPDVVMACCGDVPTLETLAAVSILRERLPELKVRVVNVVDLMKLQPQSEHPHGLSDRDFDELFTRDKPVIFAFHAYPWLIHRLTYRRTNHDNIHVRGYKEEGTITTPFDMTVLNEIDRFHLVMDTIDRVPQAGEKGVYLKQQLEDKLVEHKEYIDKHGEDLPEVRDWKWDQRPR